MTHCCCAKSLQSCPTLFYPIDYSSLGSPGPRILQAKVLERISISFSNACKWKVKVKSLSSVWLLVTPWTAAYQAPRSMGFSRQEYWSGVPLPSPSDTLEYIISKILTWNIQKWNYWILYLLESDFYWHGQWSIILAFNIYFLLFKYKVSKIFFSTWPFKRTSTWNLHRNNLSHA